MTLYLVRHGKDDDSVRGGWSDHGLVPLGVEQVNKLASEVVAANMNIDYANQGLKRGRKTAQESRECKYVANKSHKALLRCMRQ